MVSPSSLLQLCICCSVAWGAIGPCEAQTWATLKGKFVLIGESPQLAPLQLGDDEVCQAAKPTNKSLLLGDNNQVANVLVFLRPARGKKIAVHPAYDEAKATPAELDNRGCEFVPRIALVRTGQPLVLKNSDPTNHNTKAALLANDEFNITLPANREETVTLEEEERLPMPVSCSIHPFMQGYLVVRDNPYMATSDDRGEFQIANIPAGKHEFQFWHERSGYLKNVEFDGGSLDRRGRVEIEIPDSGEVDLGTLRIPASLVE